MTAAACLTIGLLHLGIGIKQKQRAHLLFAIATVSLAGIAACELLLMHAQTPEQFGAVLRVAHIPVFTLVVSIVFFVRLYFRAGRLWLAYSACGVRLLALFLNFYFDPNLNYREITGLRHLAIWGGETISVAEGVASPWTRIGELSSLLFLAFLADASVTLWRRANAAERHRIMVINGSFGLFILLAAGHAALVHAGVLHSPYLISLAFLPIVVAMSYELSKDVVRAAQLAVQLREREVDLRRSERRMDEAAAALRESEERFRMMANTAPVMIWMTDANNLSIFFNDGWLAFTGRTLEQESGNGWAEGVHRNDLERCLQICVDSFNARQSFTMEFRLRRWDGEYRWMLDTGVPRFEQDGTFVGYTGSCIDVTERKQSDDLLRHERAFLRQVIDINPNLIFAKDRESRFTLVNQATADLYGTTVENLVGKTHADFSSNVAEAEHFHRVDREVMDTLQERFIAEEQITGVDGKVRWLQTVKRPIVDENGSARQLLGSATDITQRKEAELELARQRNELAHLSRVAMLGEMSGSIAHELSQPLTAILSNAQAAQRFLAGDDVDLDELREILKDIVKDNKHAGEVIHGLRQLLKKGDVEYQPVDLNDLVWDVIRLVRSDLVNGGITMNTELAPLLPLVNGDPVQLQQVLINLVVNGCDAMSDAVVAERQLVIRTAQEDGRVRVAVVDNGRGIAPENIERVFEPFYTTKAQGLGLGLAVCRTIISAQGGRLWAENNTTRGASFNFTVPRIPKVEHERDGDAK
jgi:two-component system, LuxR family, sensor kinase FixL